MVTFGQFLRTIKSVNEKTFTQSLSELLIAKVITEEELTQLIEDLATISQTVKSVRESLSLPIPEQDDLPIILKLTELNATDYKSLCDMEFIDAYVYLSYRSITIERRNSEGN